MKIQCLMNILHIRGPNTNVLEIMFQHKLFSLITQEKLPTVRKLKCCKIPAKRVITTFVEDNSQLLDPHPACCKCIRNVIEPIIIYLYNNNSFRCWLSSSNINIIINNNRLSLLSRFRCWLKRQCLCFLFITVPDKYVFLDRYG